MADDRERALRRASELALQFVAGRDGDGAAAAVARQRAAHLDALAGLESVRADAADEATRLVLDGVRSRLEADLAWLDRCEQRLTSPAFVRQDAL